MFHLLASKAGGAASNHVQFSQGDWLGDLSMVDSICSLKCMPTQQSRSFIVDSGPLFYLGIFNGQHHNCQAPAIPPWAFWFQTCSNLSLVGTRKFDNFDADWYLCQADRLWWETEASAILQRWTHHPHGWGGSAWPQRWTQREVQDISCNSFHMFPWMDIFFTQLFFGQDESRWILYNFVVCDDKWFTWNSNIFIF